MVYSSLHGDGPLHRFGVLGSHVWPNIWIPSVILFQVCVDVMLQKWNIMLQEHIAVVCHAEPCARSIPRDNNGYRDERGTPGLLQMP